MSGGDDTALRGRARVSACAGESSVCPRRRTQGVTSVPRAGAARGVFLRLQRPTGCGYPSLSAEGGVPHSACGVRRV